MCLHDPLLLHKIYKDNFVSAALVGPEHSGDFKNLYKIKGKYSSGDDPRSCMRRRDDNCIIRREGAAVLTRILWIPTLFLFE